MDVAAIGKRVRILRKLADITQEQLAEKCGLSPSFIGHIEGGTRIPSLETICRLAKELNVSLDYLVLNRTKETKRCPFL